jgi:predicted ribosomally synthesized peptide with SipW-like signal peptide
LTGTSHIRWSNAAPHHFSGGTLAALHAEANAAKNTIAATALIMDGNTSE